MIVLVGFMGAGKTTVGRELARALGLPFRDSDLELERRTGRRIPEIFAADGEARFRELEHRTVVDLLAGPPAVLALGGGAVGDPRTREALRGVRVVYLELSLAEVLHRVGGDEGRPLLRHPDLAGLHASRLAGYREVAELVVPAGGDGTEPVVAAILAGLGLDRTGARPAVEGPEGPVPGSDVAGCEP